MSLQQLDEEALFHAARAMPGDARGAYLTEACAGDGALLRRLLALLEVHDRGSRILDTAAIHLLETTAGGPKPTGVGQRIGPYHLLEQIGEGGMGVVYVADQLEPIRRQVALKIIKPGMDSRQVIARFEAERQTLAMMDHPHIARILDAGTTAPSECSAARPYFVMELARGTPITEYCDQAELPLRQRLELFVSVCQAVQHAHQKGIIHRDLKPSNVLVTLQDAAPVAKVIDFGVSKATHQPLSDGTAYATMAQLVGTPLYMSPEQADLGIDVDTRSDIYSLGVILYELLTGETTVRRQTVHGLGMDELRRVIREEETPAPSVRVGQQRGEPSAAAARRRGLPQRRLRELLHGELDWIALKALEKDRQRRYASAGDLAADIERYLHDLPVHARPVGHWRRARKWCRRHPAGASLALAGALLVIALAGGGWWHRHRLAQEVAVSESLRRAGLERERLLQRELYSNDIRMAWQAAMLNDPQEARRLLERYRTTDVHRPSSFTWHYLHALIEGPRHTLRGHNAYVLCADVSPNERYIASGDKQGEIKIWEVASGREIHTWHYAAEEIISVRFSPDGRFLATAGKDRTVRVWKVGSWEQQARFAGHELTVTGVAWSPDAKLLASAGRDGQIHVWDVDQKARVKSLPQQADVIRAIAWSGDGRSLATANGNDGILLWDTADWSLRGKCSTSDSRILAIAFSRDSREVAFSGYGGIISVFTVADRKEQIATSTSENVWALAFTPHGELIVAQSGGRTQLRALDRRAAHLRLIAEVRPDEGTMRSAIATPGNLLVTAREEARCLEIRNFATAFGREYRRQEDPVVGVLHGRRWIVTTDGAETHVRRIADDSLVATLPIAAAPDAHASLSPSGDLLSFVADDGTLVLFDAQTWTERQRLRAPTAIRQWAVSRDAAWVAAGCDNGLVGLFDVKQGTWRELLSRPGRHHGCVAFSPTDNLLAVGTMNSRGVELWRPTSTRPVADFSTTTPINVVQFSPDGSLLCSGDEGGYISLWKTSDYSKAAVLPNATAALHLLAFSPDGRTLASGDKGGAIRLWDLETCREFFPLVRDRLQDIALGFASDRQLVVVTNSGHELLLFNADRDEPAPR